MAGKKAILTAASTAGTSSENVFTETLALILNGPLSSSIKKSPPISLRSLTELSSPTSPTSDSIEEEKIRDKRVKRRNRSNLSTSKDRSVEKILPVDNIVLGYVEVLKGEEFAKVPGFKDATYVSSLGRVFQYSPREGYAIRKNIVNAEGKGDDSSGPIVYLRATDSTGRKFYLRRVEVARLFFAAFYPNLDLWGFKKKPGTPFNSLKVEDWLFKKPTSKVGDRYLPSGLQEGENNIKTIMSHSKLTPAEVVRLRRKYTEERNRGLPLREIFTQIKEEAEKLGIKEYSLLSALRGNTWALLNAVCPPVYLGSTPQITEKESLLLYGATEPESPTSESENKEKKMKVRVKLMIRRK